MDDINIIGAGIAGLALAIHFEKSNIPYQIYEQAPSFKTVGAGILLANNAMQIFNHLGLAAKLSDKGNRIVQLNLVDQNLGILSEMSMTDFEQQYNVSNIAIHRADLQECMLKEISHENIHMGYQLTDITEQELIFNDKEQLPKGIVIGADGIHSTVRKLTFGDRKIDFARQICWRGVVDFKLPKKYTNQFNESWGDGARFGFAQINNTQVYWFALCNYKNSMSEWDGKDWRQSFRSFNPLVSELLNTTPDSSVHRAPISQLKLLDKWYNGSTCLIGDACHAMTPNMGQGAGQGIEDAHTLSQCLQKSNSIEEGFQQFQNLRFKKVKSIVQTSWRIGKVAQLESKIARYIRNMVLKSTPKFISQNQSAKVIQLTQLN